ncbi:cysteine hydrolase family protein [Fructilactobacillus hinvesii]|uniref:Cysteine hydrolase family protein n=1 Tax=Fructilactobacillus hinvesii TaxID=2940300 RepID=A0ABY5BTH5_9LACO|nr:cysteine hydrolase family protein [Fructilactobacillus hinvesii]USS88433.1 cysteine hydrolase family protein [Fructilactobacillus hinvesii]
MTTKKALLIIDYTNDFVADNGALTLGKPAQAAAPAIISLANDFVAHDQVVILPTDLHQKDDPYHPETKLFPPHNLKDTWGREFYGDLQPWYDAHRNDPNVGEMDKTRYSSFAGTDLDLQLRARGITELHLTGVATDICLLHTAVSAYNLGYQLVIHPQATAGFSKENQAFALNHFQTALGARIEN